MRTKLILMYLVAALALVGSVQAAAVTNEMLVNFDGTHAAGTWGAYTPAAGETLGTGDMYIWGAGASVSVVSVISVRSMQLLRRWLTGVKVYGSEHSLRIVLSARRVG